MSIPPDPYPDGQSGVFYAGTTSFVPQAGGAHVRCAEIRGATGQDVLALDIAVIAPHGQPTVPIVGVAFNVVNISQPQIVVTIQSPDGSPIGDGYVCQFSFQSVARSGGR